MENQKEGKRLRLSSESGRTGETLRCTGSSGHAPAVDHIPEQTTS